MTDHAVKLFLYQNSKTQVGFFDSYETAPPPLQRPCCTECEFSCSCQLETPERLPTRMYGEMCEEKKRRRRISYRVQECLDGKSGE